MYISSSIDDKIFCPSCSNFLISKDNIENREDIEFSTLKCQNCSFEYTFLYCKKCAQKIFMKIDPNPTPKEYNGLNGYNIKCPNESCNNIFYFTICPKCKKMQKISQFIKEGDIITCYFCDYQYIQIHSPFKSNTEILVLDKNQKNIKYLSVINATFEKKIIQKLNCYYCSRPIVFHLDKNHRYIQSQKVICPYSDCKKAFNKLICPSCNDIIYIKDGNYEMGSLILCNCCKHKFGLMFCHHCRKINILIKKFKFGLLKCGFQECLKESNVVSCIFCKKLNFFDLSISLKGKNIKCGYCKNNFNVISCPYCKQMIPFPLADFTFGKLYKCQYRNCMKEFNYYICPKCFSYYSNHETEEGQKMKCEKCQIRFRNIGCPFCKLNLIIYNSSFKIGQLIQCPNENCKKIFSFINCSKCGKLIFSQENECLCGKLVICPYQNCNRKTLSIICPLCNCNIVYPNKNKNLEKGEEIKCGNCKKFYKFQINNNVHSNDIIYLKEYEGNKIGYGIEKKDDNYLKFVELFSGFSKNQDTSINTIFNDFSNNDKNIYNINYNKAFKGCMICHNNIKESVFYPCGHRCTCYNCAVIFFTVNKKCPKCKKEATLIIQKVYE